MASSAARPLPVIVLTGQSGAGKGTLIERVMARMPMLKLAVSATTRERRPGEEDGREYHFLSEGEFQRKVEAGEFLEHVCYVGNRYGTLREEVERITTGGGVCVLELEIAGALSVRDAIPNTITIFITAPIEELERRLRARETESSGEIDERVAVARQQLESMDEFDYVIENRDVETATSELEAIVKRELNLAGTMSRP